VSGILAWIIANLSVAAARPQSGASGRGRSRICRTAARRRRASHRRRQKRASHGSQRSRPPPRRRQQRYRGKAKVIEGQPRCFSTGSGLPMPKLKNMSPVTGRLRRRCKIGGASPLVRPLVSKANIRRSHLCFISCACRIRVSCRVIRVESHYAVVSKRSAGIEIRIIKVRVC
jgi:hypothetical protein